MFLLENNSLETYHIAKKQNKREYNLPEGIIPEEQLLLSMK